MSSYLVVAMAYPAVSWLIVALIYLSLGFVLGDLHRDL